MLYMLTLLVPDCSNFKIYNNILGINIFNHEKDKSIFSKMCNNYPCLYSFYELLLFQGI